MLAFRLSATAATLLVFGSSIALAVPDSTPNDKSAVMAKLDPDNDGTVSIKEIKAAADARFGALDTDHDGTLDASELTGIMDSKALDRADPDKDKTLDKAEFLKIALRYFKKADIDNDGTLDAKELTSPAGRALVALLGG